jgi:hypothetical protein
VLTYQVIFHTLVLENGFLVDPTRETPCRSESTKIGLPFLCPKVQGMGYGSSLQEAVDSFTKNGIHSGCRSAMDYVMWNWSGAPPWDPYDLDTPMPPDLPWWQRWRLREKSLTPHLLLGVLGGLLLSIFAHGY